MPLPPYTWQQFDFLTASRLNQELRQTEGQFFLPNGAAWHAQRPVYKTWLLSGSQQQGGGASNWTPQWFNNESGTWFPQIDSAAFIGGKSDLAYDGSYGAGLMQDGGGAANSPGGIHLYWTHQPFNAYSGGVTASAAAGVGNEGGQFAYGTNQAYNSNPVTPWCMTLTDGNQRLTGWYEPGGGNPSNENGAAGDGSGGVPRQHALWASVYGANGTKVTAIPGITNGYNSSSVLTAAELNAQLAATMNLLNMPPMLNVGATAATSCNNGVNQVVDYGTPGYDTYNAFNASSNTYTVPLTGLYLVCCFAGFDAMTDTGYVSTGVQINGNVYNGPTSYGQVATSCHSSKVQIFSLEAGDTIQHVVQQVMSPSSSLSTSTIQPSSMLILWLGAQGSPDGLFPGPNTYPGASTFPTYGVVPSAADFTYLFQAGTPGSQMPGILNTHMANDLAFLLQKPYCMAYQTIPQGGINNGNNSQLGLDTNAGIVHGDLGSNYSDSAWSSDTFTAPVSGWYLCVTENFMSSSGAGNYVQAGFAPNPAGAAVDYYELKSFPGVNGGGASAVSLYYMRAGDSIWPLTCWRGSTGSLNTYVSPNGITNSSHFEAIWVSS